MTKLNKLITTIFIFLIVFIFIGLSNRDSDKIVAGKGWKNIVLGADKKAIDDILGKPDIKKENYRGPFLRCDYLSKGIRIEYTNTNKARKIFFINNGDIKEGDPWHTEFKPFKKTTNRGVKFGDYQDKVEVLYGEPRDHDDDSDNWKYIGYENIGFHFVYEKLVEIAVFN